MNSYSGGGTVEKKKIIPDAPEGWAMAKHHPLLSMSHLGPWWLKKSIPAENNKWKTQKNLFLWRKMYLYAAVLGHGAASQR